MIYSERALHAGSRIAGIRIHHTRFKEALEGIGRVVQLGNYFRHPVGVSIIAPAGSGKTLLIDSVQTNVCEWPFLSPNSVIVASLKEAPTVSQIQDDLLANFNYAIPPRSRPRTNAALFNVLADAIEQHDIRLIALDEFQHVFLARKVEVHAAIIDWTKRLMSRTACPVLLSGTETLKSIERADPQLSTRIPTVITLPAFGNDEDWRGILQAFASAVPEVDLSSLCTEYATAIFKATKGTMRLLKSLVIESSMIAIDKSEREVNKNHLGLAFRRVFGADTSSVNPFE
ncbi:TniB family NTP-binding protein [Paraburkholderia kururiensis]|uniref:TniB family NTP-binding protein n=1 Tax=Paraburkholderia kururiensis TaxID=984307 RepID=UPI0005A99ACD|nr:TniB family NTP-binding protein [Paraburkholderia kururiensis]